MTVFARTTLDVVGNLQKCNFKMKQSLVGIMQLQNWPTTKFIPKLPMSNSSNLFLAQMIELKLYTSLVQRRKFLAFSAMLLQSAGTGLFNSYAVDASVHGSMQATL